MENELNVLKIILKANLTKNEIKTVVYLLKTKEKTIKTPYSEIASDIGFTHSNLLRTIKKLRENNVIGERNTGIFVKSLNSWKAQK